MVLLINIIIFALGIIVIIKAIDRKEEVTLSVGVTCTGTLMQIYNIINNLIETRINFALIILYIALLIFYLFYWKITQAILKRK